MDYILTLLDDTELIYIDDLENKLSTEFHMQVTDNRLETYALFIQRYMPEQEFLLQRIHILTLDKLKQSLW